MNSRIRNPKPERDPAPESQAQSSGQGSADRSSSGVRVCLKRWTSVPGFTLIEIMAVVAILGIILSMGIPSIYRAMNKDPMRQTVKEIMEACSHARARAILGGQPTQLVFYPQERRFEIRGGGTAPAAPPTLQKKHAGSGTSGTIHERLSLEMLDVNLMEFKDADTAVVNFQPNGTCDEMTIVLRSDKNEWRKISLEVTTALASVSTIR